MQRTHKQVHAIIHWARAFARRSEGYCTPEKLQRLGNGPLCYAV